MRVSINVRTLPCGFRFAMSGTLPPILLKSSMENSTSHLSNKTNIESCAIDTKSKVWSSRRRETRIRAHLHDNKLVPTSSLTVARYFCFSWRRANQAVIQKDQKADKPDVRCSFLLLYTSFILIL